VDENGNKYSFAAKKVILIPSRIWKREKKGWRNYEKIFS